MKSLHLFFALVILISVSCKQSSSSNNDSNNVSDPFGFNPGNGSGSGSGSGSGTGSGGNSGGSDWDSLASLGDPCVADAGQTINCYTITGIKGHGTANAGNGTPINNILFASNQHLDSGISQNIFTTDSRFNLRVIVRDAPAQGSTDEYGNICGYQGLPYSKLSVTVGVRNPASSTYTSQYTFNEIPVNGLSKVYRFFPPQNLGGPLAVDILDVEWDYSCLYSGQGSSYCPMAPVWHTECVELDFQFSTDYTRDLPGERIN